MWTTRVDRGAMCGALLLAACTGSQHPPVDASGYLAPLATPAGITLQLSASIPGVTGRASSDVLYADGEGMALYTQEAMPLAARSCDPECARTFVPVAASAAAAPVQGWTLTMRADGLRQWAFHLLPVYRCIRDKEVGDALCDGYAGTWHIAAFRPERDLQLPGDVSARETSDARGVALVDDQGLTLYIFQGLMRGSGEACTNCTGDWVPMEAPVAAASVGDFSVIARNDGINQWAYHDKALYKFRGDQRPGDVLGEQRNPQLLPALIARYFMPDNVSVFQHPQLGKILVTSSGQTLYERDRVIPGEHQGFREDRGSPALGRSLGAASCDQNCGQIWRPLRAAPDSLSSAYWSVLMRPDGTRQWAYKGFALYTYSAEKPGEINGNEVYELARLGERRIGSHGYVGDNVGSSEAGQGIGGFVWHAVIP